MFDLVINGHNCSRSEMDNTTDLVAASLMLSKIIPQYPSEVTVNPREKNTNVIEMNVQSTFLQDIPFTMFMRNGLTLELIKHIESEMKGCLHNFGDPNLDDLSCVQFLYRYDTAMSTTLTQHFTDVTTNVYADENYSLTNFSSKFMHDLNLLCADFNVGVTDNPMKEYMTELGQFLKNNIFLCRKMGLQNEKHNLIGLYYKLYMVHLSNMKNRKKYTSTSIGITDSWVAGSDYIHYSEDLFQNITLLIFYAMIHTKHSISGLALLIFSQFIMRVISGVKLTAGNHNAAHIVVMCEDLPGIIALMNQEDLWNDKDAAGLLPMESAMIAMLHTNSPLSTAVFVACCLKSNLIFHYNTSYFQTDERRIKFIYDMFMHVIALNSPTILDIYEKGFFSLYNNVWDHLSVIHDIPRYVDLYCLEDKLYFDSYNKIFATICDGTFIKVNALDIIVKRFMSKMSQKKTKLLETDFATLASVPIVLEDIKNKMIYNTPFGAPRILITDNETQLPSLINEEKKKVLSIDSPEYSAIHFLWSPFFKQIASFTDYRLVSGSTLNDSNSIYAYGYLLGMFEFYEDVITANSLLKQKLRKLSGNSKHAKSAMKSKV